MDSNENDQQNGALKYLELIVAFEPRSLLDFILGDNAEALLYNLFSIASALRLPSFNQLQQSVAYPFVGIGVFDQASALTTFRLTRQFNDKRCPLFWLRLAD
jgi:phosphatidylserine synthase